MNRRGVTLVEVLIVIAILLLLAAIAFAIAGPARESARQSACMNNLRQIYTALELYAVDYPEAIVGSTITVTSSVSGALEPYGLTKDTQHCPDATRSMRERWGSTYYWQIMLPPPNNKEWWIKRRQTKVAKMLSDGGDYVIVACGIHDELYYQPREQDVDPSLAGTFLILLHANGSVTKERTDVPRTRTYSGS